MRLLRALTACAALGVIAGANAGVVDSSGSCTNIFLVSACSTPRLSSGGPISGTPTTQPGSGSDGFLTGTEPPDSGFDFGSVNGGGGTGGASGVNPDLGPFPVSRGTRPIGPGPGPGAGAPSALGPEGSGGIGGGGGGGLSGPEGPTGPGGEGSSPGVAPLVDTPLAINAVPEPATLALLGFGLVGFGASRTLRRK